MARRPAALGLVAVLMIVGLAIILWALSVPMQHGATLWQAIAVIPQAVLWPVPAALALPALVALALRVRPKYVRRPNPDEDLLPRGSLAAFADLLRRAIDGRWARSRVAARLARAAIHVACLRHAASEEEAWARFQEETARRDPEIVRFFRREGLFHLSGEEFGRLVDRTLSYLERYEQEV